MDRAFWLERWEQNHIGFHKDEVNSYLQAYWEKVGLEAPSKVFVPLCGKTRDLLWLRAQGHEVFGIEWSPIAVRDFFAENALVPDTVTADGYEELNADGIVLRCGDFFDLTSEDLSDVSGVYDRASLISLPPQDRQSYARHLLGCVNASVPILLITLEYNQTVMSGPPFSVSEQEVHKLFGDGRQITRIYRQEVIDDHARFRNRGLNSLVETVYLLGATE